MNLHDELELTERRAILRALVEAEFSVSKAAKALRVSHVTLYRKLKQWRLVPPCGTRRTAVLYSEYRRRCAVILEEYEKLR